MLRTLSRSKQSSNILALLKSSNSVYSRSFITTGARLNVEKPPLRIERELPNPFADRKKHMWQLVGFSVTMALTLSLIFNYEKTQNPIIDTTLHQLRGSNITRNILGENIQFDGLVPWVYGKLNPVAGKVDIKFYIKGTKDKVGTIKLIADRNNHNEEFLIHEWSLTVDDQKYDLLTENLTIN
ncbi:hypothetical protein KAFR_0D02140 [Kazachstania africana CBS 2517]|uniref:Cytochrome c oxidase assembly factor 1 n=1 Tax=Kazachstania africana (strain ATCC 22294 / BCRC 22015 / CBS 2517 / CECT 1963 / NBRC 1671 / NRRL Y-8276) TaxID=1071382 RepID=H2AU11_KAZAF|nr:hypothetical protein KAFR_0D02140 [Kazachstania africana CBS 2517]CCF57861.1 hypothetical protein KAFR_0D02140 [Kazachstania africana CBS 2517]